MRTPKGLSAIALFLMSASIGAAAIVVMPLHAQSRTVPALADPTRVDPQILLLQSQVANLQAQLNALATVLRVTPTGLFLQASTVTIAGGGIKIQSQGDFEVRVNNLHVDAMSNASLRAGSTASVEASGTMDVRGSSVRLNGGTRPVAFLGSTVANGQVLNGSPTVFAN